MGLLVWQRLTQLGHDLGAFRFGSPALADLYSGLTLNASYSCMVMLDQSLKQLEALDPRGGEVLHLTYFAGLDRVQIADVLGISLSTVDRELRFARAWLSKSLAGGV